MPPGIDPAVEFKRQQLDEHTWVDFARGWIVDQQAVYDALTESAKWRQNQLWRYEKYIPEPRLTVGWSPTQPIPHPVLLDAHKAIQSHYGVTFGGFAMNWYRDGEDCQAFHRDRDMRYCENTIVALLSLGERRPWLLRRRDRRDKWIAANGGAVYDFSPAGGDLMVLGGRAQLDWEHSVPQVRGATGRLGRISVQWRWTSGTGRPEPGGSYGAPRHFSRR